MGAILMDDHKLKAKHANTGTFTPAKPSQFSLLARDLCREATSFIKVNNASSFQQHKIIQKYASSCRKAQLHVLFPCKRFGNPRLNSITMLQEKRFTVGKEDRAL